ncbi:50S ribosomal protein L11 [archaeon]|jgi:large subunit ribosomal protein L11|nr:50S ribosomal protein L11 [archaeon]MBT6868911.1 50S ribosomal protein L11 [archaeon]MBT7192868.1 50S ribosomal protein L11 [archaeon]MBT7380834.1 50S ribosomal protein L11 [archaeon]MBT7507589.1 50S ribosomal protein L11 [archaeon]
MAKESVEVLIEGGKATAAPPLGPALGPTGVNIGLVISEINKKTADFKGMKVPVKVIVDNGTKEFEIEIGTPPAAQLIKKEAKIDKGAGNPLTDNVADLLIEQVIKVSKMKESALLGADTKARVREIVGTCQSMGVSVEGMRAPEALKAIKEGQFNEEIKSEKTELTDEEIKKQAEEKKRLSEELKKKRDQYESLANSIKKQMSSVKDMKKVRTKMQDAGIPLVIINEIAPLDIKKKR